MSCYIIDFDLELVIEHDLTAIIYVGEKCMLAKNLYVGQLLESRNVDDIFDSFFVRLSTLVVHILNFRIQII